MNRILRGTLVFLLALCSLSNAFADDDEAPREKLGQGQAVEGFDKEKGIRLSDKAKKTLSIQTVSLSTDFKIPSSALVHERGETGVYVQSSDWFKYIEVKAEELPNAQVKVTSSRLHSKDQIVIQGVALLRLAEIDATNGSAGADND